MSTPLRIVVVLLLVLGNAIFVAAEYALVTGRRSRLEERAARGGRGARTALRLMDDPVRFISTVQVGITIFAILLGAIGEPLISGLMEPPLSHHRRVPGLVRDPDVPLRHPRRARAEGGRAAEGRAARGRARGAPRLARAHRAPARLGRSQLSANAVLRVLRVKPAPAGMIAYTREDIRHSVAAAEDVGELETAEEEMLYKVFDFASKEVSAVMVPRPQVVGLSVDMPPEDVLTVVVDSPYTRYPVYRVSLDEIVGVLHVRDLFAAMHDLGHRVGPARGDRAAGIRRPRDEGPGRPPRRLPP